MNERLKPAIPWMFATVAGIAGFFINGFRFPISDDLELVFGSILSFFVLLAIGTGPGILAATLVCLRTFFLWDHAFAIPFLIAEAAVVGFLTHRREFPGTIGVVIYWAVAGPVMYFFFVSRKFFPDSLELAITLKFITNNLLCVIIADAILAIGLVRSGLNRLTIEPRYNASIRYNLSRAFLFITILPICVLAIWSGQSNIERQKQSALSELKSNGVSLSHSVGDHLDEHKRAIEALADYLNQAPNASNEELKEWLTRTRNRYQGFATMLVADQAGNLTVTSPEIEAGVQRTINDREYYRIPLTTKKTYISDTFQGRGFGNQIIIAISAPLLDAKGQVRGIVEGSVMLSRFPEFSPASLGNSNQFVIVTDQRDQIAFSNRAEIFPLLTGLSGTPLWTYLKENRPENTFYLTVPFSSPLRLPDRHYLGVAVRDDRTRWTTVILRSSLTTQAALNLHYFQMLGWMLGFMVIASFLAQFVANTVIAPLKFLTEATKELSHSPEAPVGVIFSRLTDPIEAPAEIRQLINVFTNMAKRLESTFNRLQQTNIEREIANQNLQMAKENLDRQVRERTAQLARTIEELKKSKADAERNQEQLRQSQKMEALGQLAGGIAHNFNNLLAVIMGYNSLELTRIGPDSPSFKSAKAIRRASERGRDLVRHLLSFSRSNETTMENVSLHESIQTTVTMVEKLIGEHISLQVSLSDLKPTIFANLQEIEQVFLNLMLNARDAMPEGGTLTIRTGEAIQVEERDAPGKIYPNSIQFPEIFAVQRFYRISIEDQGMGMSPDILEKLFEPFFTTKEQGRGTGLGLATAFGTVTKAGGFLRVESTPGKGSVFHVYLPWGLTNEGKPYSGDIRPSRQFTAIKLEQSPIVLVVEDESEVLEVTCEILRAHGFVTLAARDGEEALTQIRNNGTRIDFVLSDVRMPKMNGPKMASELQKLYPETPILFMSGYNELADTGQIHFFDNNLIRKPFEGPQLIKKIQEMLKPEAANGSH
jgi:signal transduction histidine kinase